MCLPSDTLTITGYMCVIHQQAYSSLVHITSCGWHLPPPPPPPPMPGSLQANNSYGYDWVARLLHSSAFISTRNGNTYKNLILQKNEPRPSDFYGPFMDQKLAPEVVWLSSSKPPRKFQVMRKNFHIFSTQYSSLLPDCTKMGGVDQVTFIIVRCLHENSLTKN